MQGSAEIIHRSIICDQILPVYSVIVETRKKDSAEPKKIKRGINSLRPRYDLHDFHTIYSKYGGRIKTHDISLN